MGWFESIAMYRARSIGAHGIPDLHLPLHSYVTSSIFISFSLFLLVLNLWMLRENFRFYKYAYEYRKMGKKYRTRGIIRKTFFLLKKRINNEKMYDHKRWIWNNELYKKCPAVPRRKRNNEKLEKFRIYFLLNWREIAHRFRHMWMSEWNRKISASSFFSAEHRFHPSMHPHPTDKRPKCRSRLTPLSVLFNPPCSVVFGSLTLSLSLSFLPSLSFSLSL